MDLETIDIHLMDEDGNAITEADGSEVVLKFTAELVQTILISACSDLVEQLVENTKSISEVEEICEAIFGPDSARCALTYYLGRTLDAVAASAPAQ